MVVEQLRRNHGEQFGGGGGQENFRRKKVVLEGRYFRRVTAFERDLGNCCGWLFDLNVVIGWVDKELAGELERLLKNQNKISGNLRATDFQGGTFIIYTRGSYMEYFVQ